MQDSKTRLNEIEALLQALPAAWNLLLAELEREKASLTADLIAQNNDETRGRIKALQWITELPDLLRSEQASISAALSEKDAE